MTEKGAGIRNKQPSRHKRPGMMFLEWIRVYLGSMFDRVSRVSRHRDDLMIKVFYHDDDPKICR